MPAWQMCCTITKAPRRRPRRRPSWTKPRVSVHNAVWARIFSFCFRSFMPETESLLAREAPTPFRPPASRLQHIPMSNGPQSQPTTPPTPPAPAGWSPWQPLSQRWKGRSGVWHATTRLSAWRQIGLPWRRRRLSRWEAETFLSPGRTFAQVFAILLLLLLAGEG